MTLYLAGILIIAILLVILSISDISRLKKQNLGNKKRNTRFVWPIIKLCIGIIGIISVILRVI
ncbi:hypothetical protein HQ29_09250 [Porphyromonas canoris]|uniref:hypothetical protein n=1 Tax=Porphyromonas canoris TaxID=36875 RepID=UPI00051DF216|nr:hypothetical protein [Porphyromonas canoris]KGL51161.1 hypothetical protein HQ29_09250 [Porphyromonas canoris]